MGLRASVCQGLGLALSFFRGPCSKRRRTTFGWLSFGWLFWDFNNFLGLYGLYNLGANSLTFLEGVQKSSKV